MQRRDIERGARDARDRARHRGRHRRAPVAEEPLAQLRDYLAQMEIPEPTLVDLDHYARATVFIDLGLGERFRQLAVELECRRDVHVWRVLEPVYDAALAADPRNPHTWSSWAVARWHTDRDSPHTLDACIAAGRRAVSLGPDDGSTYGVLGMLLYQANDLDDARRVLERGIELGGASGWDHLWLAHTLHDLERWTEAADAYAHIPRADFASHGSWRIQLARQQRACCLLRAGRREAALAAYSEVLVRFERALDAGLDGLSSPVLAMGPPEHLFSDIESLPELADRASRLRTRLDQYADPCLHTR